MNKDMKDYRKEIWINIATSVANASNCGNINSPTKWADEILKEYDERFPVLEEL